MAFKKLDYLKTEKGGVWWLTFTILLWPKHKRN